MSSQTPARPPRGSGAAGPCPTDPLAEWLESQVSVSRVWLDRLIAEGDPNDLVSTIHRQAQWLDLMVARLKR